MSTGANMSHRTKGAKGFHHWWAQRLTAIALIPLSLWFAASVIMHAGADRAALAAWLSSPLSSVLMILTLGATLYHGVLGLGEVIVDYVHCAAARIAALIFIRLFGAALAVAGIFAVLRLAFTG
ncbi:MAG: succinate dehydrogenase, hydrophobic membrane anchor protein [Acidobacteriia bacterium]|nr:succinate dehydrogenase, hydrophobic membrane anchor protein [Terriglobia bacterium]